MINFPFGTNGKSIILGVSILKHITVERVFSLLFQIGITPVNSIVRQQEVQRWPTLLDWDGSLST